MCSPLDPEVLGYAGTPSETSSSRTHRATSSTLSNVAPFVGIEIDRRVVGVVGGLHPREPRVLRDGRDLRHVQQRRQRSADQPLRVRLVDRLSVFEHLDAHTLWRPLLA